MQQQKQKKIPVRRCVGCNAQRPKRELVRVVRSPEGEISIDLRGKAPGRGAYLCPSAVCLAKARKAKRLERTFEVPHLFIQLCFFREWLLYLFLCSSKLLLYGF